MKPIASASMLKVALLGGVAIGSLLSGAFQASAEVGVTAAVNVDARGRPPGAAPRVLALGANIVHNEQVTTDGQGLVQILLLDGTTFTVGPNSNLTIDEFVYNPETGDAKVVASLTKGVFRFVGARTSQTEGGATVKTPVGTIGIRGGVANFSYDPSTGESKAALVAGKSLTISRWRRHTAHRLRDRLYGGYHQGPGRWHYDLGPQVDQGRDGAYPAATVEQARPERRQHWRPAERRAGENSEVAETNSGTARQHDRPGFTEAGPVERTQIRWRKPPASTARRRTTSTTTSTNENADGEHQAADCARCV